LSDILNNKENDEQDKRNNVIQRKKYFSHTISKLKVFCYI